MYINPKKNTTMSKQINIGGRIHSTEVGNVTTGANEVLDDTKGKKQNVINSETDAELLRLDQSKQNNLTFDNTPTENSNNPVKSSGVYAADKALSDAIEAILLLIPSAATALNQLADKAFVNSSVSTATATFRGTYNVVTDLELAYDATHEQIATKLGQVIATADNNDYAFVQVPVSATSTDIRRTERYKFNGTVWGYEYDLNTSGFTAAQWEAINSGITALLVSKLTNLPTAEVLATMFNAKQNVLTFDEAPAALSTNPVYSGGVYAAIKAITDLIPAEATTTNQLADKAYVLASILAATPAFKGQFTSLVDLQAVSSPKAGDIGIVRTKDNDGKDVFTVYQYLNNQWNVYFSLSYHPQTKPATTGTTGDYPYNGMGRVELPMNIVGGVNTLTQSMMPTATGGNTVYVIKYDFALTDDVTVPANCVLEFDGGSINGNYTITFNYTELTGVPKLFNIGIEGELKNSELDITWFGAVGDDSTDNTAVLQRVLNYVCKYGNTMFIPMGIFCFSDTITTSNVNVKTAPNIRGVDTGGAFYKDYSGVTKHVLNTSRSVLKYTGAVNKTAIDIYGGYGEGEYDETEDKGTIHIASGGSIRDIYIFSDNYKLANGTIGLQMSYCANYTIFNVAIIGFGKGFVNFESVSWNIYHLITTGCAVGIELQKNSCGSIFGLQCHDNSVMGVHITGSNGVYLYSPIIEGCAVGICIEPLYESVYGCNDISILYPHTEVLTNRNIIIGANNQCVDTELQVQGVILIGSFDTPTNLNTPIYIGNALGVEINNTQYGGAKDIYECSENAYNVSYHGSYYNTKLPEVSREKGLHYINSKNLFPNGFNNTDKNPFSYIYMPTTPVDTQIVTVNGVRMRKIHDAGSVFLKARIYTNCVPHKGIAIQVKGRAVGKSFYISPIKYDGTDMTTIITIPISENNGVYSGIIPKTAFGSNHYVDVRLFATAEVDGEVYLEHIVAVENTFIKDIEPSCNMYELSGEVSLTANTAETVSCPYLAKDYNVQVTVTGNNFANVRVVKSDNSFDIIADADTKVDYSVIGM